MPEAGTFFRCYYIIAPLGEGGMSEVFLGYDLPRHRLVALKFLVGFFGSDPTAVGRMKREGEIYRKLDHPNVVKLVDTGPMDKGGIFLVQEFLRGLSLREALQEEGQVPLELTRVMVVLEDVASALGAAHRQGIIHRDVKPDNIMICPDGRGTVFDFGIAYRRDDLVDTQAGTIMGTLSYSAPEARQGEPLDARSDIYGLGAVFYEVLTGQLAIQVKNFKEILEHHIGLVPPPTQLNPRLPACVDLLWRRLMADDPEDRYQDLKDLLIDIGKLRLEADEPTRLALFGTPEKQFVEEAASAYREGDLERAKTTAARLAVDAPEGMLAEIQHLQGRIHLSEGHRPAAIRAFERAQEQDPYSLEIALDLAMALMAEQEYERATEALRNLPTVIRGNFLVRSLLDTIQALPEAPPSAWDDGKVRGGLQGILGSLRSLWKG
jgi:serine/threonine protein kinase